MCATAVAVYACGDKLPQAPVDLRVEYGETVVDTETPRFSWTLNDTIRGASQTAYQVLVATSNGLLTEKKADVWNSGKIASGQSVFIEYDGTSLEPGKRYFWCVRTWNATGDPTRFSNPQYFDVAMLEQADNWKATWIGAEESAAQADSLRPLSILLRKEFSLKKNVRTAKVYVTGLGSYQLFINGEKVSNDLLTPGWTDYPTRIMYQVYEVSDLLRKGNNAAGITLGNMWYSSGLGWRGGQSYSRGPMKAMMQMEVQYVDGSTETVVTDDSWKWHFSPILENTLYHGEVYDARMEIEEWSETGLDEAGWSVVDTFGDPGAILSAHVSPPIQVTREIEPVEMAQLDNGNWVFDMGVNLTGGIRLKVEGDAGRKIEMRFAELLHPDGSVAQENLRSARATDVYIMKGGEAETWEPAFTYHGFRYVEISGLPADPDSTTVTGLNYHNAAPETGTFECSADIINKIQANIQNGQRSNMFSVPTDCPQRDERLGWMGDAQIFAATSCYNMDMSGFYAKWVRDIYDSQSEEGWVTDVNPAIVVTDPAKPAWGDAYTVVPWEMYRFYRDTRLLETYYDGYKAWVEYMRNNTESDGLYIYDRDGWGGYADWIAVVESPKQPISAAYYYYSTKLLARFAEILGKTEDAIEYSDLADAIRKAFNERYFEESKASYEGGTQTALLLPVNFSLTPSDLKSDVVETLHKDVADRGYHPSTGFLGTKYLLPTLSDYGYHEAAFRTATGTEYPSWGYMVVNGATSMWELWNSDTEPPDRMNSRNHFALGSCGEWYYSHLAGIRIDEDAPGFKHSIIAPMPADELDWVKGSIVTPYGPLKSEWEKVPGRFTLNLQIPANTTATLQIPILSDVRIEVYEGGSMIMKGEERGSVEGITLKEVTAEAIVLDIVSGTYSFDYLF